MYFAIDIPDAAVPDLIAQQLLALRSEAAAANGSQPLHLLALLDGACDEEFFTKRYPSRLRRQSLYAHTSLQNFKSAAPHLMAAPSTGSEQAAWLQRLFSLCAGKPMLSIIASTLDIGQLEQHLRPYLIAITPDTVEWPVRWADTRILPALLAALTETQSAHLLSPIYRWWSLRRDGSLVSWQGTAEAKPAPAEFDKFPLSDTAFASLVDIAEADAILANLHDVQPDLFHSGTPAECHARVARHLLVASASGIEAAGQRQHFSALALMLADDFTLHPAMASLLRRTRQGASYLSELDTLPDDFWQARSAA
ncbi:DUF4123 domain-containing protein [Janthinobacterium sp. GW458P]|uniref:DUF4123 domain-containing protein n=1 Tax=Janthinobacterium sp. GW458P TaxID=1981504 RepID=UPI000A320A9C|nr:DUF4123 domain-containing protein [Janthinobacterium sp. GW458P]MBE3023330.1 DUF4123 domain-containing protein [Janthinobacterium sp. GW458P]PHV18969.1 DUF4123 domain-containing protein [Janthinobacterium sp. BJB303]